MSYEDSVSTWLTRLSAGDESAVETAFNRYFTKLTRLATSKMVGLNQAVRSGEDLALSAFRSFCSGLKAGRLTLDEESDLWACLFCIVTRKAYSERRRESRLKRGGQFTRVDSTRVDVDGDEEDFLANVAGREPSPELAAEMASQADEILRVFGQNPKRRQIIEMKLSGASDAEIAQATGLSRRTVNWHLAKIRERLEFVTSAELLFEELFFGSTLELAAKRSGWTLEAAKRVRDSALKLWSRESTEIPVFRSEQDALETSNLPDEHELGKTLNIWTRRVRESWTDDLFDAFNEAPDESDK